MRRRFIIVMALGFLTLCFAVVLLWKPNPISGNFPPGFSQAERREIISAARKDSVRQMFIALKQGQFRHAWRWTINARKQKVQNIGNQQDGQIHVVFAVSDPTEAAGYFIWARYLMVKKYGHWAITTGPF